MCVYFLLSWLNSGVNMCGEDIVEGAMIPKAMDSLLMLFLGNTHEYACMGSRFPVLLAEIVSPVRIENSWSLFMRFVGITTSMITGIRALRKVKLCVREFFTEVNMFDGRSAVDVAWLITKAITIK